jgi:hypothetical protein
MESSASMTQYATYPFNLDDNLACYVYRYCDGKTIHSVMQVSKANYTLIACDKTIWNNFASKWNITVKFDSPKKETRMAIEAFKKNIPLVKRNYPAFNLALLPCRSLHEEKIAFEAECRKRQVSPDWMFFEAGAVDHGMCRNQ